MWDRKVITVRTRLRVVHRPCWWAASLGETPPPRALSSELPLPFLSKD